MRERALREMGLAPGWVRRHTLAAEQSAGAAAAELPAESSSNPASVAKRVTRVAVASFDLEALRAAIEHCQACPRASMRSNAVPGEGPKPASLMVVDLVPSKHEATHGALLDSDAARLFDQLLFALGLKREAIYLSHALRCDGAAPTEDERASCAPYLQREIELVAPVALLALGSATAEALAREVRPDAPRVFVLSHPRELLSDVARKRGAWVTLRELRSYLAEKSR